MPPIPAWMPSIIDRIYNELKDCIGAEEVQDIVEEEKRKVYTSPGQIEYSTLNIRIEKQIEQKPWEISKGAGPGRDYLIVGGKNGNKIFYEDCGEMIAVNEKLKNH